MTVGLPRIASDLSRRAATPSQKIRAACSMHCIGRAGAGGALVSVDENEKKLCDSAVGLKMPRVF